MTQYRSLAHNRLTYSGEPRDVDNGVVEFMAALCELEEELLGFEIDVSSQELDAIGLEATRDLNELEVEHSEFLEEIKSAHQAIVFGHLTRLDRNPAEDNTGRTQQAVVDYRDYLLNMITRLEDISDRIGRRIDAKRNSANTRLIFSVSAIAAIISIFSLLSQLIGMVV